jgi:hypothetical protein|eukprot:COSAG01_NODE_2563_length_7449_cov_10.912517_8_plen_41_part_00
MADAPAIHKLLRRFEGCTGEEVAAALARTDGHAGVMIIRP